MANSSVSVTEGSGKNLATYSFTETTTKEVSRVALNTNAGVEIGSATSPVRVSDIGYSASATFTPAASAHGAGTTHGAAAEIDFNAISGSRVMITSASLEIDNSAAEATTWRVYLYNVTPPGAYSDTTTFDLPSGDRASFLGYVDLGTAVDLGSTQWVETHGINKQIKLSGDSVFAYLVAASAITPGNSAHIVTLHAIGL